MKTRETEDAGNRAGGNRGRRPQAETAAETVPTKPTQPQTQFSRRYMAHSFNHLAMDAFSNPTPAGALPGQKPQAETASGRGTMPTKPRLS